MPDEPLNATGEWKIVDEFEAKVDLTVVAHKGTPVLLSYDPAVDEEPEVVDHRLRETGNGPEVSYEEALLREYFGDPDDEGVYR